MIRIAEDSDEQAHVHYECILITLAVSKAKDFGELFGVLLLFVDHLRSKVPARCGFASASLDMLDELLQWLQLLSRHQQRARRQGLCRYLGFSTRMSCWNLSLVLRIWRFGDLDGHDDAEQILGAGGIKTIKTNGRIIYA